MSTPTATSRRGIGAHIAAVLAHASEDQVTAALYRSPDYQGWTVLELAELFAVIELDHGLTPTDTAHVLAHADQARLGACRSAARVVLAAQ